MKPLRSPFARCLALSAGLALVASAGVAQTPPTFAVYPAPNGLGTSAAEPSIGVNWNSDAVMYIAGLQTLRLEYDECTSPPGDTWTNVSADNTSITSLDPILFTDSITGRTFASQLAAKCSNMSYTDDDGETWMLSQGCGINAGVDHQTVGGGPYNPAAIPPPPPPTPPDFYPHAVYYCSQDVAVAQCARSDNGGLTFGPAVPIYNVGDCGGLHGAIHVGSGGTVYVPNKNCGAPPLFSGGNNAVAVSEDNGLTWAVNHVTNDGTNGNWDPSVWAATEAGNGANGTGVGTLYMGMNRTEANLNRRIWAAVSNDNGQTWSNLQDIGAGAGPGGQDILNAVFPVTVAGDGNRAAIGFLGAVQGGDSAGESASTGHVWHAYVAMTFDGGQSWETTNVTPGDPVQRGQVCDNGPNCAAARNLLDFNDMAVDAVGRVVFGFADGCLGTCAGALPNSATELATVVRQVSGRRLFAAFDGAGVPGSPRLFATQDTADPSMVHVSWLEPDDRGSAITGYDLYKRLSTEETSTLLMSFGAGDRSFDDTIDPSGPKVWYSIEATNGSGTSAICREVSPTGDETPCIPPGLTVLEDGLGDWTLAGPDARDEYDIERLSINERPDLGPGMVEVTLKMVSMAAPLPSSTWPVSFTANGARFVRMHTDATGAAFFTYGTGTDMSPATNPGTAAHPASGFSADGSIRIVVARADIGAPAVDDELSGFLVRIRREGVAVSPTPDNMPDSLTPGGSYRIFGSEICSFGDPPIATDDVATTLQDAPVVIDVIDNDISFNGALAVVAVTDPPNGSVADNGDGTLTYVPDPGFFSPPDDIFEYTVEDQAGLEDVATVTVTVNEREELPPHCEPPGVLVADDPLGDTNAVIDATDDPSLDIDAVFFAEPDSGPAAEKLVATLEVEDFALPHPSAAWRVFWTSPGGTQQYFVSLENCDATTGLQCSYGTFDGTLFSSQGQPEGCAFAADGTITITVDKGLVGIDDTSDEGASLTGVNGRTQVFVGAVCSGLLGQADNAGPGAYVVQTNASCRNQPPVAVDDSDATDENTPVVIDVLANDSDPDGDPISVVNTGAPSNGTVENNGSDVTYTPNTGFDGVDSFIYTISDGIDTDDATVTVTVNDTGDGAPTADDQAVATNEDTAIAITLTASDPENDPLTYAVDSGPANGGLSGSPPNLTYTPDPDYNGPDSFTFHANDGDQDSNPATVSITVTPVNDAPTAQDDSYATAEETTLEVAAPGVLANDTDPDSPALSAVLDSDAGNGDLALAADGSFSYTPDAGFCDAVDFFTYHNEDGEQASNVATVTIQVSCGANQPPTADHQSVETDEDTALDVTLTASDPNGDALGFAVVSGPASGSLSGTAPELTYTPDPNFNGSDSFTFEACDAEYCDQGVVSITVRPVNDPPLAMSDEAATSQGTPVEIDVLANDTDPDDGSLQVDSVTDPDNGGVTINANGTVTYTPDSGFFGTDFFFYTVCDPHGACDTTSVTVTVLGDGERCDYCAAGKPSELTLTYVGGSCAASANTQGSKAECTDFAGPPPAGAEVFIIASDDEDADSDSDREWFRGTVSPDGAFTLLAANGDKDDFGSKLFVHVFSADGATLLQTLEIHTSCSAPLVEGERFGSVVTGDAASPGDCPLLPLDGQGRVHGSGHLDGLMGPDGDADSDSDSDSDSDADSDSEKVDFSFDAKYKNGELEGKLKLHDKEVDVKIDARTITSLSPGGGECNGVATSAAGGFELTAVGEFNGIPGAEFRVCGEDNGKPGKGDDTHPADRFFLECLSGCTYDTAARTPDDGIDGGNIHLHDAIAPPGGGGTGFAPGPDGSETGFAAEVIDLDPMLVNEAIAGSQQVLTAVVSAANGAVAVDQGLTLFWQRADGTTGSATSLTDGLGVAVFALPVEPGDVRYWVELDTQGLESNGISLRGLL